MIWKKIVVFFRVSEVGNGERRSKVRLPLYIMMFNWQWSQIVYEKAAESFIWSSDRIRVRLYNEAKQAFEAQELFTFLVIMYGDGWYIQNVLLSDGLERN
jgi:hypothetical protein